MHVYMYIMYPGICMYMYYLFWFIFFRVGFFKNKPPLLCTGDGLKTGIWTNEVKDEMRTTLYRSDIAWPASSNVNEH